jgi:hypothetical protein
LAKKVEIALADDSLLDAPTIGSLLTLIERGLRAEPGADLVLGFAGGSVTKKVLTVRGRDATRLVGGAAIPREF